MTFIFTLSAIMFFKCRGQGSGISVALYPQRWRFWHACQRIGKQARGTFFFALPSISSPVLGGQQGVLTSFYSQGRRC